MILSSAAMTMLTFALASQLRLAPYPPHAKLDFKQVNPHALYLKLSSDSLRKCIVAARLQLGFIIAPLLRLACIVK